MSLTIVLQCLSIYDKFDTTYAVLEPNNYCIIGSLRGPNRLLIPNIARNHARLWLQDGTVS